MDFLLSFPLWVVCTMSGQLDVIKWVFGIRTNLRTYSTCYSLRRTCSWFMMFRGAYDMNGVYTMDLVSDTFHPDVLLLHSFVAGHWSCKQQSSPRQMRLISMETTEWWKFVDVSSLSTSNKNRQFSETTRTIDVCSNRNGKLDFDQTVWNRRTSWVTVWIDLESMDCCFVQPIWNESDWHNNNPTKLAVLWNWFD